MSHEHRALGFRPPPGSLAAEAQAAAAKHAEETKARKNSNDGKQSAKDANGKRRRSSNDANGNGKQRRGSNDANGKPRRGSNEKRSGEIRRTNSDQANGVANGSGGAAKRRASSHTNGLNATAKEELLREAAVRDAERIKYVPPPRYHGLQLNFYQSNPWNQRQYCDRECPCRCA